MNIPTLSGNIRRRILVNFRAAPNVIAAKLPAPFRPKLHDGAAIVGVCLIRLEEVHPALVPLPVGFASENAAHRIAVLWDDKDGQTLEGVFVPRRDTGSALNHLTGGRLFPGQHHLATFEVCDNGREIDFRMRSHDKKVEVRVKGQVAANLPPSSCFSSLEEASAFFESGSVGYSVRSDSDRLDGLKLEIKTWRVEALDVSEAFSSYYCNTAQFPEGSIVFDHALLMRNIRHKWHATKEPMQL